MLQAGMISKWKSIYPCTSTCFEKDLGIPFPQRPNSHLKKTPGWMRTLLLFAVIPFRAWVSSTTRSETKCEIDIRWWCGSSRHFLPCSLLVFFSNTLFPAAKWHGLDIVENLLDRTIRSWYSVFWQNTEDWIWRSLIFWISRFSVPAK